MIKVYINGRMVGERMAAVSVFDRSFLYGDCAFETMRSYGGAIFRLDDHIERLLGSLEILRIGHSVPRKALKSACETALASNRLREAYVRIAVTRGQGRIGISHKDTFRPNVVVIAKPFEGYPARMHQKGISVAVADTTVNERSPLCRAKSANFMPYILARQEAQSKGFDDAILLNTRGDVAEGATSNLFIFGGGSLITPSVESGALAGITRREVIGIAGRMGLRVKERRMAPSELKTADEVFFTNSLAEVLPVVRIGPSGIGPGRPGLITRLIHSAYKSLTGGSS